MAEIYNINKRDILKEAIDYYFNAEGLPGEEGLREYCNVPREKLNERLNHILRLATYICALSSGAHKQFIDGIRTCPVDAVIADIMHELESKEKVH